MFSDLVAQTRAESARFPLKTNAARIGDDLCAAHELVT